MLAQLNKVPGVRESRANRSGTLVRLSLDRSADADSIAAKALLIFADAKRKATRLTGADLVGTLSQERWYGPDDLSAIEFRIVAQDLVRAFARSEKLDEQVTGKLVGFANEEWDRLPDSKISPAGGPTNWKARCSDFAKAFIQRAGAVLTAPQMERLEQAAGCFQSGGSPKK